MSAIKYLYVAISGICVVAQVMYLLNAFQRVIAKCISYIAICQRRYYDNLSQRDFYLYLL
jgi:hypothetical protein